MWTTDHQSEFDQQGFVRLRGVFSPDEAAAMESLIWGSLQCKHGVVRDDRSTWSIPFGNGLQPLRTHPAFEPNGGPALTGALNALLGEGRWQRPKHWGSFLVTFPPVDGGFQPAKPLWHTDYPYSLPLDRLVGALVFSFVSPVPPQSGGTLVVAGSHRIVARFATANPHLRQKKMKVTRHALMNSDPWLKAINVETGSDAGEYEQWSRRFMTGEHAVEDIPVRVGELTGEPGDVIIGHPWLLHSPWPNRGDRPRFMRVQRIVAPA